MPAFAYRHIKDLYPIFWSKSKELVDAITYEIRTSRTPLNEKASDTAMVEFGPWLSRATLDIIGVAGMGYDFRALQDPDTELNVTYRSIFTPSRQAKILGILGLFIPTQLLRLLPVKRNDDVNAAAQSIRKVSRQLIEEKQAALAAKRQTGKDILSVALESGGFTVENLVDQTMTFLAAGHETTATASQWALVALCENPSIQSRLREEIRANLPALSSPDSPPATAESLASCHYLHAFCNEVLRVYAPVPLTRREAAKDTSILGQFVPKGTDIILSPFAINMSRELWGEDAEVFNPDRWMGPGRANSGGADSNYSLLTFLHGMCVLLLWGLIPIPPLVFNPRLRSMLMLLGVVSGPRSCIGLQFAKAEFACLMAAIVGRFEMELKEPGRKIEIETGITAKPKGSLELKVRVVEGW
jgi:cytochrome P450